MTGHNPSSVVIYVNGASPSQEEDYPARIGHFVGKSVPGGRSLDPAAIHHSFPEKWRAYLHAAYRNHFDVAQVFQVSERAARRWWNGEGGVNGGYVAVAVEKDPVTAPQLLFAAE